MRKYRQTNNYPHTRLSAMLGGRGEEFSEGKGD
jgi:hypothetical protein